LQLFSGERNYCFVFYTSFEPPEAAQRGVLKGANFNFSDGKVKIGSLKIPFGAA